MKLKEEDYKVEFYIQQRTGFRKMKEMRYFVMVTNFWKELGID